MHPEVATVMQELDAHRARFIVFCRALSAGELERPVPGSEWLVRDFIAHLATIDGPVAATFTGIQENRQPEPDGATRPRWDVDRWNQGWVEERRAASVDELFAEAAQERVKLQKVLAAFDEELLGRTLRGGGDSPRAPAEFEVRACLRGWCKHDPMHVVDMLRGIPDRRTAIVEQWIDDPVITACQAQMNRR